MKDSAELSKITEIVKKNNEELNTKIDSLDDSIRISLNEMHTFPTSSTSSSRSSFETPPVFNLLTPKSKIVQVEPPVIKDDERIKIKTSSGDIDIDIDSIITSSQTKSLSSRSISVMTQLASQSLSQLDRKKILLEPMVQGYEDVRGEIVRRNQQMLKLANQLTHQPLIPPKSVRTRYNKPVHITPPPPIRNKKKETRVSTAESAITLGSLEQDFDDNIDN